MKNYIGFANDHSGSMNHLSTAALKDFNANTAAIRNASTREMQDTIVSVTRFGVRNGSNGIDRPIVNSNPHVLKPMTDWPSHGDTPLFDAVGNLIELFESMPDYKNPDVSFLVIVTTDGGENDSKKYRKNILAAKIAELNRDGRWTFVFRVPRGHGNTLRDLNVPHGNIQEWDTTAAGMAASTAATTAAMDSFYASRSTGVKSSGSFYASAANVTSAEVKKNLADISAEVSSWTVLPGEDGIEIKPFAEKRLGGTTPFLKGSAFYQLNKVEPRVQDTKRIIIRDKKSGLVYEGAAARAMIGLPATGTVRVNPGQYSQFDIFIQSTSINRKLVAGTNLLYWPKVGEGFKAADFPWLTNGQATNDPTLLAKAAQAIQQSNPTPVKTVKKAPTKAGATTVVAVKVFFDNREAARKSGKVVHDAGVSAPKGKRWYVYK